MIEVASALGAEVGVTVGEDAAVSELVGTGGGDVSKRLRILRPDQLSATCCGWELQKLITHLSITCTTPFATM